MSCEDLHDMLHVDYKLKASYKSDVSDVVTEGSTIMIASLPGASTSEMASLASK